MVRMQNMVTWHSFPELLIFFWLTLVDIYCLEFISHYIKEMLCRNTYPKGKSAIFISSQFHENIFLKVLKQLFCRDVNLNIFLNKCPCYYVLIFFFFQTHLTDTLFDVQKVKRICFIRHQLSFFLLNYAWIYPRNFDVQ